MSEIVICTAIALLLPIACAVKDIVKYFRIRKELSK